MKTLNIFAILFIVSIVNTNKVTYSDVAQSLLQLQNKSGDANANLQALSESFQDSHKALEAVSGINQDTCKRLVAANVAVTVAIAKRVAAARQSVKKNNARIKISTHQIKYALKLQGIQAKKITDAKNIIAQSHVAFAKAEAEIEETVNILIRLKNIAVDELAGKTKITTEMGNYNVVNNHGVSFIQRTNMKEVLRKIMAKTEIEGKSLISSLIMMSLSDDAHYSDPKIVRKILNVLNRIIAKNENKRRGLKARLDRSTQIYGSIIANGFRTITNLEASKVKSQEIIELSNRKNAMMERDIEGLQRANTRRHDRAEFQREYCQRQQAMMATYQRRYAEVATRINDMRAGLQ